jgi:hypothetical protein
MKCPICGLYINKMFYPLVWENHMMLHDILGQLILLSEKLEGEGVKK